MEKDIIEDTTDFILEDIIKNIMEKDTSEDIMEKDIINTIMEKDTSENII